ncbi:MAG: FAD-dependent oxidoreductase [Geminicoccaceae bacterium]
MVDVRYQTAFKLYPYERSPDQDLTSPSRHPVVIVGGGPIGMALALDLSKKNVPCLVLDDHDGVGQGSRAICFAKRTLEICDRLGAGDAMVEKGVVWNLGRVYREEREIYNFNLLPEEGHKRPAFINLQQPYFEKFLVDEVREQQASGAPIEIRGQNRVTAIDIRDGHAGRDDHVGLDVDTPDGPYRIEAGWLVATDGASSSIREMMGLGFEGRVFEDNFLIADIKMKADFPTERRFWFNPPFNPNETALLHKQPDDVWRLDFQLGWDIDRKEELQEDNIRRRVRGMIGPDIDFDLEWTSIYTFRCCTMKDYRHGRVFFAGDAAHQVSPFGARGANGGMQDMDNLAWKLALVIDGHAPERLLDSYHEERKHGALENILNSSRTADFLTPRSYAHHLFRDAVLDLAEHHDFARPMVNSGRLSVPCRYDRSALNGPDELEGGPPQNRPGSPCTDVPLGDDFLLDRLGDDFIILTIDADAPASLDEGGISAKRVALSAADDPTGALSERYLGASSSAVYLIRPDQHAAARFGDYDEAGLRTALRRALGKE